MQTIPSGTFSELARLYGVEPTYENVIGRKHEAPPESVLKILRLLGAPVDHVDEVADALHERREAAWRRWLEPVTVAWQGRAAGLTVRMPSAKVPRRLIGTLHLEGGGTQVVEWAAHRMPVVAAAVLGGTSFVARRFPLPDRLPRGCHRLVVELGGEARETLLISAPTRAYTPSADGAEPTWGVFAPLYALHSEASWGAGDFSDLGRLLEWVRRRGGGVVATLPLLAAFLGEPFEPSPYSPASRLFWNEFYLDVAAIPELATCPTARSMLGSHGFAEEVAALRRLPLVDYHRQMTLKRGFLEALCHHFFHAECGRRAAFEAYVAAHPRADDYARFRAAGERLRSPWPDWPTAQRDGVLGEGDYDEAARRYHLYVQWLAEEQLERLASAARRAGPGLYLDLPLGVHGQGYDVWRERRSFASGASGGCPPDLAFPRGQDWGFPPLHPEGIREDGYRYVRAYLRHQMRHAGVLRIDHIPAFHRLYWIPEGMEAGEGAYVRYAAEELYALFNVESHRHRTLLVGEDLGTVPPEVPESMGGHGVHRMYVLQYTGRPVPEATLPPPPATTVASLNTHDMPPFAAFLGGTDIGGRAEFGLMGGQDPGKERETRRSLVDALHQYLKGTEPMTGPVDDATLLRAGLEHPARSDDRVVLVNLEDLWLERQSQNIPSSSDRHSNWRKRSKLSLERLEEPCRARALLDAVNHARHGRS